MTVSAHDVAAHILQREGPMSAMKLQKLLYYSQSWHLVWADRPLFREEIQAWANGPVVYEIFDQHRGRFSVGGSWPAGDVSRLGEIEKATIDTVCDHYSKLTGQALSALTHSEDPWRNARGGLPATARSTAVISLESMAGFYGALAQDAEAEVVDEIEWGEYADYAEDYAEEMRAEMAREYEAEAREYEAEIAREYEDPSQYM